MDVNVIKVSTHQELGSVFLIPTFVIINLASNDSVSLLTEPLRINEARFTTSLVTLSFHRIDSFCVLLFS